MEPRPIGLCWGTVNQATLAQMIEAAARYGFPTISFAPNLYDEALDLGIDPPALRRHLADAGVKARVIDGVSTGLPGLPTNPYSFGGRLMRRYDPAACIVVAEAVGASVINVTHYGGEWVAVEQIAEAVAEASRLAAESGVTIALEFIPGSGIPDLGAAQEIAEMSAEQNCTILLDTWHLARSGGTVEDIRALPPGVIGAFQLADRIEPEPGAAYVPMSGRALPGEGELPLGEIVAAVLENSPHITIELEVFSEELAAMTVDSAAARAAEAVQSWRRRSH